MSNMEFGKNKKNYTTAIIAAAGSGTRMGEKYKDGKMLLALRGQPIIAHTLTAYERADSIDEVVVVCREEDIVPINDIVKGLCIEKVSAIVRGGAERQDSVEIGLKAASPATKFIAVHDGARPIISPVLIDKVVYEAHKSGAAALGIPETDTLKKVYDTGYIAETVSREKLYRIQTPQVFNCVGYAAAIAAARQSGQKYTDDCQLYEACGKQVKLVRGSTLNIKVTSAEDLELAESLLGMRYSE